MKIVFLAPFGIRPKGTLIARMLPLAVELQELGHHVVIVAPPYTNPEDSGMVETVRGVTIRNIRLGPQNKMLSAPLLAARMFRTAMAEKPDIVHLFKPKGYGGLAAMLQLALTRSGLRLPGLFIDTDDWEGKGGMNSIQSYSASEQFVFRFQEEWLLPRASGVTVASRALQTRVWGMGVPPDRVLYLPNCVEDVPAGDGTAVRQKLGISAGAPVVLLYTRFFEFSRDKLYFVFSEIRRQVPEVRFLVVGKGRSGEESLLEDYCHGQGFGDSLVMGGWLQPADIPSYLAAADVAIYPFSDTLVNRAKCPAKLTEILRAGVPVVADNVGQLAEYVRPGVSGILCNPDNRDEMPLQTVQLLSDRNTRLALGAAGRKYLLETFNWKIYAARLNALYCSSGTAAGSHNGSKSDD